MYQKLLPKGAEVLVEQQKIDQATLSVAEQINREYADKKVAFLTIMNGGMIFASELSLHLNIDMEMDYLQLSRYGKSTTGGQLVWKYQPEIHMHNKHVILCDDIYDQGHTLKAAHDWCLLKGAASVKSVVLVYKKHDRGYADYEPEYTALKIDDHYIFGYGMDLEERLRHLRAIYYLPDA
ncbi:hypoxanthine-guanine phosphoribosyltransferase [Marinicella pacifica]|uniref:Hypoxanthine-guanine phosphoribosyltransferase n=1 Tax=Marinicella pacifica TaxID=1171543 RepID=A0A917CQ82_9GAMM|nr:hypoxanthine-guanine phosphoribosyltransferase [Marinicella pacifica]GGF95864.1 hypoxanthine-guanine phosphoribosyltransferase [Marinicella pacifica]